MRKNTKKVDREQVKFLLTVLGVIIWVGGAIYERYKKNMARRRPNVSSRRPVAAAVHQASVKTTPAPQAPRRVPGNVSATPAPGLSVSFDDEGRSYFAPPADETAPSQSDDTAPTCETAEDRRLEDLRRAVVWSEILRRKF